jgi:hypothetical protein
MSDCPYPGKLLSRRILSDVHFPWEVTRRVIDGFYYRERYGNWMPSGANSLVRNPYLGDELDYLIRLGNEGRGCALHYIVEGNADRAGASRLLSVPIRLYGDPVNSSAITQALLLRWELSEEDQMRLQDRLDPFTTDTDKALCSPKIFGRVAATALAERRERGWRTYGTVPPHCDAWKTVERDEYTVTQYRAEYVPSRYPVSCTLDDSVWVWAGQPNFEFSGGWDVGALTEPLRKLLGTEPETWVLFLDFLESTPGEASLSSVLETFARLKPRAVASR